MVSLSGVNQGQGTPGYGLGYGGESSEQGKQANIRAIKYAEEMEFKRTYMPLTTEQKTRLDCVTAICQCAKELDINCIEQVAYKANLLMQFVLDGKPIERK